MESRALHCCCCSVAALTNASHDQCSRFHSLHTTTSRFINNIRKEFIHDSTMTVLCCLHSLLSYVLLEADLLLLNLQWCSAIVTYNRFFPFCFKETERIVAIYSFNKSKQSQNYWIVLRKQRPSWTSMGAISMTFQHSKTVRNKKFLGLKVKILQ